MNVPQGAAGGEFHPPGRPVPTERGGQGARQVRGVARIQTKRGAGGVKRWCVEVASRRRGDTTTALRRASVSARPVRIVTATTLAARTRPTHAIITPFLKARYNRRRAEEKCTGKRAYTPEAHRSSHC